MSNDPEVRRWLRGKPVRTQSGVAPVTVLTKPFPCPGECIFCPNDIRMPKSYLADEPGAQRAERNWFDPYLQLYSRLEALATIGHDVDKVEIIVLGGTWSFYPETYQIWFIDECFTALNDWSQGVDGRQARRDQYQIIKLRLEQAGGTPLSDEPDDNKAALADDSVDGTQAAKGSYNKKVSELFIAPEQRIGLHLLQTRTWPELAASQRMNETAGARCVGLVLETRPDAISEEEVIRLRRLGCTKAQIGVQSTQDSVLLLNKRGHDVAATRKAFQLLRLAGFKIHAHWMANLYGSTPELDIQDYVRLVTDPALQPDELKIYPCSLVDTAELMQYYRAGKWQPYSEQELLEVLKQVVLNTPPYARLTRVIRDIPSHYIVDGNKKTNFRQLVETLLRVEQQFSKDIRAREIGRTVVEPDEINLLVREYQTADSTEYFLEWNQPTPKHPDGYILGFLRLSIPVRKSYIEELRNAAIIREIHVYGELTPIGAQQEKAQHRGLGKRLIEEAKRIVSGHTIKKIAVISAVGTREYYRKQGFKDGKLYQFLEL